MSYRHNVDFSYIYPDNIEYAENFNEHAVEEWSSPSYVAQPAIERSARYSGSFCMRPRARTAGRPNADALGEQRQNRIPICPMASAAAALAGPLHTADQ